MKTMKAVRMHAYGGPEVLHYEEAPRPEPGPGEVLVRVHAAAVNPVDWKIREGYFKDLLPHALPLVPGWDLSGEVEAAGQGAARWKPGDAVCSRPDIARDGAYAEYVVIRETEAARKPRALDHVHAAALPLAGLTAWQALFDSAGLASGQRVLVHGASGGVGTLAVQLAKWKGAEVIATASEGNLSFLRALGADEAIDYRAVPFEEAVKDVDVVFDTIGGDTQQRSWKVLKPGGILVSIVSPPSPELALEHGVREDFVFVEPDGEELAQLVELVDEGRLKTVLEAALPLTEARRAQELSRSGHTRGKLVLKLL